MYYIVTALYCEAKPWIEKLGLKSESGLPKLRVYRSDEAVLVVTGTGKLEAAIALSSLLSLIPPKGGDILINAGICGAGFDTKIGSLYLCARIEDEETGRMCFPDVAVTPPVPLAKLLTVSKPYRGERDEDCGQDTDPPASGASNDRRDVSGTEPYVRAFTSQTGTLRDMEAYGVYAAASRWFKQHAMLFFKTVSDFGTEGSAGRDGTGPAGSFCSTEDGRRPQESKKEKNLTADRVSDLMAGHIYTILTYAGSVKSAEEQVHAGDTGLDEETLERARILAGELFFSKAMEHEFLELLNYARLSGTGAGKILERIGQELKENPCRNKNEGKKYLALVRDMAEQRQGGSLV